MMLPVFEQDPDGEHRIQIGEGWSVWRSALLRGAGFPARRVLELASPELAASADRLVAAQDAEARAQATARLALEALSANLNRRASEPFTKALKKLVRGVRPEMSAALMPAAAEIDAVIEHVHATAAARTALDAALVQAEAHEAAAVEANANDPLFREALLWQNRAASARVMRGLQKRDSQRFIASYLQRYCVKNDRVGFFGPAGWAQIDPTAHGIRWRTGDGLLAHRRLYYEYWCQEALARTLASLDDLGPYLIPRITPTLWLEGRTLHHPVDQTSELPAVIAAVLHACDGERSAHAIAARLLHDPELGFTDVDEVYDVIEQLREREFVTWTIELPTALADPERTLRTILVRAGEHGAPGLALLDQLDDRKADVARAAGDPVALDGALAALESAFETMTGRHATRGAGEIYAGRMLVFEQCRRDFDLTLGRDYLQRLSPTLLLLLRGARWYTQIVARDYTAVLAQAYRELVVATGSRSIDFLRFWNHIAVHFPNAKAPAPIILEARAALQAHWARILGYPGTGNTIEVQVADIEAAVVDAFGEATRPGWPSARYQSVDLMIIGPGSEAVRRGDYALCVGELHCGIDNTASPANRDLHPDPASLIRAREIDLPAPSVSLVRSVDQAKFGGQLPMSRHDFDLELGAARSWRPRNQVIAVASAVVESGDGELVVRCRQTGQRFDMLTFLQDYILAEEETAGGLTFLPPCERMPRVVIGGVTVSRRQWRMPPDGLTFAHEPRGVAQYGGARRWARDLGLPRWVFVKTPEERKPVFVDFDSFVLVETFAKLVRASSRVSISEMLPDFDQLWLPDAAADMYTCEIRMLALAPS
jgi:Lantibiotic dehydratase, N terminus